VATKIDGTKVRFWATKKQAQAAARAIGWTLTDVSQVETRFQVGYALATTGGFLSREKFGELYHARSDQSKTLL